MSARAEIEELVAQAKPVPLTPHVRIDGERLRELAAELDDEGLAAELCALADTAKVVPLTTQIRIQRSEIRAILARHPA